MKTEEHKAFDEVLQLKSEPLAEEQELNLYWKKLRHFYRTGENDEEFNTNGLTSIFYRVFENAELEYPFQPDGEGGPSFEYSVESPLQILNYYLDKRISSNRKEFIGRMEEFVSELGKLFSVETNMSKADEMKDTFDFANSMISFDKLADVIPGKTKGGLDLSEESVVRLQFVVNTINEALDYYGKHNATVIMSSDMIHKYNADKVFDRIELVRARKKHAFEQAEELFDSRIKRFSSLIKAYRIAVLDVEGAYNEDVHDDYFDHFTWHRLKDKELALFEPVVMVMNMEEVLESMASFSKLLASGKPVKIIVLRDDLHRSSAEDKEWVEAAHGMRPELTAHAISHRNVISFQTIACNPSQVFKSFIASIESRLTSVSQYLIESVDSDLDENNQTLLQSASTGRYFPSLSFKPNTGIDLSDVTQSQKDWATTKLKFRKGAGKTFEKDMAFTYADYKALHEVKTSELMLIPAKYATQHVVPLHEYLELEEDKLQGKIPFIWLEDGELNIQRAAVPNLWVISCQERLDFWRFLKRFESLEHPTEKAKPKPITQLATESKTETKREEPVLAEKNIDLASSQEEAIQLAAKRIISGLLGIKEAIPDLKNTGNTSVSTDLNKETKIVETEPQISNSDQPWIETENCTSCNECTDKYPQLFKYNEDEQAVLNDPSKGTFEQLVKAAEKCPAACIHPGKPMNSSEANLDKLIKRAGKFN